MSTDYWQKQAQDKPLFPDLLWSRPENRAHSGKLLIVGGNLHAFAAPAEAFAQSQKSGVGVARVVLPDAAKRLVGPLLESVEYAPSTPSGSFGQKALAQLLTDSAWADAVLIAGDLGRNSETAILLEKFIQKYAGQLSLSKDAVDYATNIPDLILNRPKTLLVLSFAQLQKLAVKSRWPTAFTYDMDLLHFIDELHEFTQAYSLALMVQHHDQIHCAVQGNVVSTPFSQEIWRVKTAAHAAVWWLQNPSKTLESLSTSLFG